jgi:hypothetical protein
MHRNRISAEPPVRLPLLPPPPVTTAGFVLCPLAWWPCLTPAQWLWQQAVYQWAFAQAQAVVRPSILERDLLAVWN